MQVGVFEKCNEIRKNKELIIWIKKLTSKFEQIDIHCKFYWVGGHCVIHLNELADELANIGCIGSTKGSQLDIRYPPDLLNNTVTLLVLSLPHIITFLYYHFFLKFLEFSKSILVLSHSHIITSKFSKPHSNSLPPCRPHLKTENTPHSF